MPLETSHFNTSYHLVINNINMAATQTFEVRKTVALFNLGSR